MLTKYIDNIIGKLPENRLLALDAFRGLTITLMILVNNPGSWSHVYAPLLHAKWHGWTPTDLVFPFFIFIVGISVHIVLQRELALNTAKAVLFKRAAIRASKLFVIGLFLALFFYDFINPNYNWLETRLFDIRVMGVLQRIGLVYLLTVLLVTVVTSVKGRLAWLAATLIGYWALLTFAPYADAAGNIYQGLYLFGNNFSAWLDHLVFGVSHVYYPKAVPFAFDPEGLISTFPAVATCLTGVLTGQLITTKELDLIDKVKLMLVIGIASVLAGEFWHLWFPINKALWSSSFVLMSSGYALIVLAVSIWLVDVKGVKSWTAPFVVFGANAIAFYVFSALLARIVLMIPVGNVSFKNWFYSQALQPVFGDLNGSLVYALIVLVVSYIVMHQLYRRKIIFKV